MTKQIFAVLFLFAILQSCTRDDRSRDTLEPYVEDDIIDIGHKYDRYGVGLKSSIYTKAWIRLGEEKRIKLRKKNFSVFRSAVLGCLDTKDKKCIQRFLAKRLYFPYMLSDEEVRACTGRNEIKKNKVEHDPIGEMLSIPSINNQKIESVKRGKVILDFEDYTSCLFYDFHIRRMNSNRFQESLRTPLEFLKFNFTEGEIDVHEISYYDEYYQLSSGAGMCILYFDKNANNVNPWQIVGCFEYPNSSMSEEIQQAFFKEPMRKIQKTLYALFFLKDEESD